MSFDVARVRKDFPILDRSVHGKPLAYLDNAASSQKPRQVIDAVSNYYANHHANIHRGVHALSEEATEAYEAALTRTSTAWAPWYAVPAHCRSAVANRELPKSGCQKSYIAGLPPYRR